MILETQIHRLFGAFERSNKEFRVNCPKCFERVGKTDTKKHFYINPHKQFIIDNEIVYGAYNCFRCEFKGIDIRKLGLSYEENVSPAELKALSTQKVVKQDLDYPEGFTTDFSKSLIGKACYNYYKSRYLSDDLIRQFNFGYATTGKYKGYIIMPILENHKLVYFVARSIFGKVYKNAPVSNKDIIFNFNKQSTMVLCEGIFDAISFKKYGIAILGKTLKEKQFLKIVADPPKKLYVCLDTDARKSAIDIARKLRSYIEETYIITLEGKKDPNSLNPDEISKAIKNAVRIHGESDLLRCAITR